MKKLIIVTVVLMTLVLTGCREKNDESIIIDGEVVSNEETASFVYSEKAENNNLTNEEEIGGASVKEDSEKRNTFIVYVCGEVNAPGVYEVFENSRVIDAINAAGGINDDALIETLNLASFVSDGEKIYVPSVNDTDYQGAQEAGSSADELSKGDSSKKININTADKSSLMTIPGVGESKANKIIAYREEHGKFCKTEDLMQVSGIKEGMYNKVKDYICVN